MAHSTANAKITERRLAHTNIRTAMQSLETGKITTRTAKARSNTKPARSTMGAPKIATQTAEEPCEERTEPF